MFPEVFNATKYVNRDFIKTTCKNVTVPVYHKKKVPECKNVTKENCVTRWEIINGVKVGFIH